MQLILSKVSPTGVTEIQLNVSSKCNMCLHCVFKTGFFTGNHMITRKTPTSARFFIFRYYLLDLNETIGSTPSEVQRRVQRPVEHLRQSFFFAKIQSWTKDCRKFYQIKHNGFVKNDFLPKDIKIQLLLGRLSTRHQIQAFQKFS